MNFMSFGDNAIHRAAFKALERSQAVIQFDMDGTILTANSSCSWISWAISWPSSLVRNIRYLSILEKRQR